LGHNHSVNNMMMTRYSTAAAFLLLCGLAGPLPGTAAAQEAQSVKVGEAALRFAAGSIRESMPQDGVVNFITGDNQTTGNRMILGWRDSDVLYLNLSHPEEASPGDLYTVYRRVHKVFHPATKRYLGYIHNKLAVVRVVQIDHSLAAVQVVRSFAPLSPGDPVMRFVPPVADDRDTESESRMEGEGMIVDLQADKNMALVAQGNLVYLDRGQGDGLRAGDRLEVDRLGSGLPRRKVAEIKILSTEEKTATALITRSTARVLIGDRVRYGSLQGLRAPRSEQGVENSEPFITVSTESKRASMAAAVEKTGKPARMVAGVDGLRIDLEDLAEQVEYDSGEVKVKEPGLVILEKIAEFLRSTASDKPIRVEGHADNMEIGPALRSAFPSNWELSRARAAGIVRFLVEKGGLDSAKLSAVGYGATRPVASNATEAGRKRNRRIEIVLLTTEMPGTVQETRKPTANESGAPSSASGDIGAMAPSVTTSNPTPAAPSDLASSLSGQTTTHNVAATPAPEHPSSPDVPDNPLPSTPRQ
jgi:chemotaxis protein MotB